MYRFLGIVVIFLLVNGCAGPTTEDLSETPSYLYPARKIVVDTKNPFTNAERTKARLEARHSGASLLFEIVASSDHQILSIRTMRLQTGLVDEAVTIVRRDVREGVYPLIALLPGQSAEHFQDATTAFFYPAFLHQETSSW